MQQRRQSVTRLGSSQMGENISSDSTHALYISKDPLEEFRSSSPTFVATVKMSFRLIYPLVWYEITEDDVLIEEFYSKFISQVN